MDRLASLEYKIRTLEAAIVEMRNRLGNIPVRQGRGGGGGTGGGDTSGWPHIKVESYINLPMDAEYPSTATTLDDHRVYELSMYNNKKRWVCTTHLFGIDT